jgi:hypothetical protein
VDAPLCAQIDAFRVADGRLADEGNNTAKREQQQKELVARTAGATTHRVEGPFRQKHESSCKSCMGSSANKAGS